MVNSTAVIPLIFSGRNLKPFKIYIMIISPITERQINVPLDR